MPDNARDVLASVQRLVQVGFDDLAKANLSTESLKLLNATQLDSNAFIALLGASPTRDSAIVVAAQADKMLASAEALTASLEAAAKQPSAKLINLAGRQRMLSQRMAKNYFLGAAGADTKISRDLMISDQADFKAGMATLAAAPISTAGIRNDLQLAQGQWVFFENALKRKPDFESMRNVATASERLLEVSNSLTLMYEAALKDLLGTT
jgi:hypothetical protein